MFIFQDHVWIFSNRLNEKKHDGALIISLEILVQVIRKKLSKTFIKTFFLKPTFLR